MILLQLVKGIGGEAPLLTKHLDKKEEAWAFVERFAKENSLGYYFRKWKDDGWTMIDFGSHVYFFRYRVEELPLEGQVQMEI